MALDPHVLSALNRLLVSPLRVEIDDVAMEPTSQVNLTALAREIQRSLDELQSEPPGQVSEPHVWKNGGLRLVWHARTRRAGEENEPVIVA